MVIGRRFAWAHLAKTGGDATRAMFCSVPGLVLYADPAGSNDKHMPFFGRESEVRGKLLVMNIRRLPSWALSGAHHKARHGVFPDYRPAPLESYEEIAGRTDADDLLRWMTDHGRFHVEHWLRMETLTDDFLALLDLLGERTAGSERGVRAVGPVNVGNYDRGVVDGFTREQLERLYSMNPRWGGLERELYGGLLID